MNQLTDESPMPWGIHKGTRMANVPASYLIYVYENEKCDYAVSKYILDNWDFLKMEAKEK